MIKPINAKKLRKPTIFFTNYGAAEIDLIFLNSRPKT